MSKKRKTRKQKEKALTRHQISDNQAFVSPTYSISSIKNEKSSAYTTKTSDKKPLSDTVAQKDAEYLRHDITSITAASGMIIAFDILLFVLLNAGILHLHFLGY
jgi:hypothetical protein